jgi:hypothetical protein
VKFYIATFIALITFAVYFPTLQNDFLTWDDLAYVIDNSHIRSIDTKFFKWAFFDFYAANWHPLTWISHAVDYAIWGLDPRGHHLTSVIFHAVNTFIVVILVIRLVEVSKENIRKSRLSGFLDEQAILLMGGVTGLLFGLHPLHVESVVWVAERKDVLCAMFFMLSIIAYIDFARSINEETAQDNSLRRFIHKRYLLAVGFFMFALLSKPMAVSLPVVLLILDWYPLNRIRSLKTFKSALTEKIPFIALSLASSILTVVAQHAAMMTIERAPAATRLLISVRSLVLYLWKMVWPLKLSPYYPYPQDVSPLSVEYVASGVLVLAATIGCAMLAKKQKSWLSAWGYYVVTLIPVLGIVQVGGQSMADRYTYLPSLGPFLIAGLIIATLFQKIVLLGLWRQAFLSVGVVVAIGSLISLTYVTIRQIDLWRDSYTLWTYVVKNESIRTTIAHFNLGYACEKKGLLNEAIEQFQIVWR